MEDVARGRGATVLPQVGCMSIAHDPLLGRTRHDQSDKLGRSEGKGRVKTKGRQEQPHPHLACPLPCPLRLARGHSHAGWGGGDERDGGWLRHGAARGQCLQVKSTLLFKKKVAHVCELVCAEIGTIEEEGSDSAQDTYIQTSSPP